MAAQHRDEVGVKRGADSMRRAFDIERARQNAAREGRELTVAEGIP
jgi:hypothetical protein